ncbi:MAG: ASKHA domain-containing protein [Deltaproteobacteria bacterium]|nr:ASKHA domain-containing protein [Deltaproteobacteria bacterium]
MLLTIKQPGSDDKVIDVAPGISIIEALTQASLMLDSPCGGKGRCGKCLIKASGKLSEPQASELAHLADHPGYRLACLAKIEGNCAVELTGQSVFSSLKGLGWTAPYSLDPALKLFPIGPRDRLDQRSLLNTLELNSCTVDSLETLSAIEAKGGGGWLLTCHDRLLKVWPQEKDDKEKAHKDQEHKEQEHKDQAHKRQAPMENLAAAFDLGTTGLALAVIDMETKKTIAFETSLNPQTAIGGDVISRITYAAESQENIKTLQNLALKGLRELLESALGERSRFVSAALISGNTTMLHLLAGLNPKSLALAPYRPIFTKSLDISHLGEKIGLPKWACFSTTPSISAYVGGDITSGLVAVKLAERKGTVIFIDIGTNGEIVLSRNGKLVATSCAAGPALEGMNITCGLRAITGAVDSFKIGPNLEPNFTTIGQAPAIGICGSGLIDICAELIKSGVINKTGRMSAPKSHPQALTDNRYHLTDKVFLDQKDVRQVQLAKGAIAAAMKMLLERFDLTLSDLDEIVIAGAFGFHLRPESLKGIALIPKGYEGPVSFVGNSSLAGVVRLLLDRSATKEIETISNQIEVIELGFDPKFQDAFLASLGF